MKVSRQVWLQYIARFGGQCYVRYLEEQMMEQAAVSPPKSFRHCVEQVNNAARAAAAKLSLPKPDRSSLTTVPATTIMALILGQFRVLGTHERFECGAES